MGDASSRPRGPRRVPRSQTAAAEVRRRSLGAAIRAARGQVSQAEVAERIGIGQSALSAWESGDVDLTCEQVLASEQAVGLPAGTLLARVGYVSDASWTDAELAVRVIELESLTDALEAVEAAATLGFSVRLRSDATEPLDGVATLVWELHLVAIDGPMIGQV